MKVCHLWPYDNRNLHLVPEKHTHIHILPKPVHSISVATKTKSISLTQTFKTFKLRTNTAKRLKQRIVTKSQTKNIVEVLLKVYIGVSKSETRGMSSG